MLSPDGKHGTVSALHEDGAIERRTCFWLRVHLLKGTIRRGNFLETSSAKIQERMNQALFIQDALHVLWTPTQQDMHVAVLFPVLGHKRR